MVALDEMDLRILHELQHEGRLSNQDLADRVGLSPSPCLRRVRALEASGVISGYRAVVSQDAVGLPMTAFVHLTLDEHTSAAVDAVEEHIGVIPDVVEAYLLAGDHDYLLKIVTDSLAGYDALLRHRLRGIPFIRSIQTTFAMGTTKPLSPLVLD